MLEVTHLVAGYGSQPIARLDDFKLQAGQAALLLGPSGAGKTTILLTLAGLLPRISGELLINGSDPYTSGSVDQFRGRNIGFVFQELNLIAGLSALDNILLAPFACGAQQDKARAMALLERLDCATLAHAPIAKLSRGQAQRVALARALILKPKLLIADEPTSSLDDAAAKSVSQLLIEAAAENNASLLIATHDSRLKSQIAHQVTLTSLKDQNTKEETGA